MPEMTVVAETGRPLGSRSSNRLRAQGKIPAVVYGQGTEPLAVAVPRRELRLALSGPAGLNAVINLSVDGQTKPTVVKTMQRDPVRRNVTHIDFLVVNLDEEIAAEVPIVLEGEAKEVLAASGIVDQLLTSLSVLAKPRAVPGQLVVDVSGLTIGGHITVADLDLPAGVTAAVEADAIVATGVTTRASMADEAEGAEGEAGDAEPGEAGDAGEG